MSKEENKQAFLDFCDKHEIFDAIGTLCIVGCGNPEIVKLVGIAQDHCDYYYVLLYQERGLIYDTCVDRCQSLKGKIKDYDYHLMRYDTVTEMYCKNSDNTVCYDLSEFKERGMRGSMGVYLSRDEMVNEYREIDYKLR
jgi:hypothetical protein